MKKILFILIIILITGVVFAADSRPNLLADEPFIVPVSDGMGGYSFNFNANWAGFTDTTTSLTYTNNIVRESILDTDTGLYDNKTYFVRTDEYKKEVKKAFITTRPSLLNHFNATIVPGQKYEVGFDIKADNILFDAGLTQYGICVAIDWFDNNDNFLCTSIKPANFDSTYMNSADEALYTDWTKYKAVFIAPDKATYFTYNIYFDKGIWTSTYSDKIYFANPVMYVEYTDPMVLAFGNTLNYSVYNNTFLTNIRDYVSGANTSIDLNAYLNWSVNGVPSEFSSYSSLSGSALNNILSVKVYNPRTPFKYEECCGSWSGSSQVPGVTKATIPLDYGNLENGKYIAEVILHKEGDEKVIISKQTISFNVTNQGYKGFAYGPVGTNQYGNNDSTTRYWIRDANGVSTFLLGLVDRGVNFNYLYKYPGVAYGINAPAGTVYGRDIYGSNYGVLETNNFAYDAELQADYLNPITKGMTDYGYFSYADFASLGLNTVFPAYLARIPSLGGQDDTGMLGTVNKLYLNAGCNVFLPLQEFSRNNYSRDLQYRMTLEAPAFKSDIFGAGNAFTQMAKSLPGSTNTVLGYVLDSNLSVGDEEETIDKSHQLNAIDTERVKAVFIDGNNSILSEGVLHVPYTEAQKSANVLFVSLHPKGEYWTEAELSQIKSSTNLLEKASDYNLSLIPVISIKKKAVGSDVVPLTVRDLIEIYKAYYIKSSNIAGLFFDDVASMTVADPSTHEGMQLHYDVFRLFLYEKDKQDYLQTPISDINPTYYNPIQYISVGANTLTDSFSEVNVSIADTNGDGIEDYTYYFYRIFDDPTELIARASAGVTDYYQVDCSVTMNNFQTTYTKTNCFTSNGDTTIFGGAEECLPGIATFTMTFTSNGNPLP